jgi:type VI secretion system secreted protein VgrG
MEEIQAEQTGLSTYAVRIVPTLWRLGLRSNCRIFERMALPDIVEAILAEWQIEPERRLTQQYVKHEYRVQYMETDFAFVSRLLEEAGITYFFELEGTKTKLVLTDDVGKGPARDGGPLPFVEGHTHEGRRDFATKVRATTHVRAGHVSIRDFDFRLRPDYQLLQEHKDGIDREKMLEHYQYAPGSFWVESKGSALPHADDKGVYKADEPEGKRRAQLALEAERTGRRVVRFETNAIDLAPGKTFQIVDHPRKDLADKLVVASMSLAGDHDGNYQFEVSAFFADDVIRPPRITQRPRIFGVQSAIVTGPPGEEIHTDEFGRVRVQFHWDREHGYDDESSCWIRVSQGWAGLGYGMVALPRVGQEVLVEFFDGDPDRPVVTGRVYNNTTRVPYALPENKTKSGWKTASSPGSNGFNELSFEDKRGGEEIHIQAERDLSEIVKRDQTSTVLHDRSASITNANSVTVGGSHSVNVGDSESRVVKKALTVDVGELHAVHVASGTGTEIRNKSIVSTTGGAMIILDGDDIILQAKGTITLVADGVTRVHGKQEVQIEGGKTFINCGEPGSSNVSPFERAKEPAGPGSGGATNDPRYRASGHGTATPPGGIDEAAPNAFVPRPPRSAESAPASLALDSGAARAILEAVASGQPARAGEAVVGALTKGHLDKAIQVVDAVRQLKETHGASLLAIPEVKDAIGAVVTSPIVGPVSGKDIADVLNFGKKLGVWHLGKGASAAADFVAGATASSTPGAATDGVTQLLGLKSDATPEVIDGEALDADIRAHVASGLPELRAQAAALANRGVALYTGDFSGAFTKITR